MIEFNTISKQWVDGTHALSYVSLQIPKGQFCVILGPSGAGKSTLLRAVNGLVKPTQGFVRIDGEVLNSSTEKMLRQRVAMIHQHFNLSPRLSVASNVLAGLLPKVSMARALSGWFEPEQRDKACALVEQVGLRPEHLTRRAGICRVVSSSAWALRVPSCWILKLYWPMSPWLVWIRKFLPTFLP